jgi:eukaryotic-like serine/threonine-protein kinase
MRRLIRYLLRVLVLFVVFMVSALTAMRFAIHGRQTAVPKVVGMSSREAQKALDAHGLVLESTDRFYSADVPEGRILSQVPQPGEQVRRGWRVRIAESMGPQRVVIPDLGGASERAAEINIRRRGLEMGTIAIADIGDARPDQIVAQSPPANATNVSTPKVSILVAAPEERKSFVMPDLRGKTEDEVINVIVGAGLKVGSISTHDSAADSSDISGFGHATVTKTIPGPGQRIYEGQSINLEVTR